MLFHCHEKLIRANAVTMQRPINTHKNRVMMAAAIAGILAATTDYAVAQEVNAPVEVTQAAEAATNVTVEQAFDTLIAEAKEQMMTDPARAVETATKAAQLVETIDEFENRDRSMATALWLKGEAYLRSGQPEAGQPLVASALILLGDADAKSKLRADLLLAQGRIAGRAADMELAVRSYYEAHDIFVVLKEARNEAITLMALGSIYRDAEAYDKALSYYERAAEIYSGDARIDLSSANNRANILKELGRHGEARDLFHDALAVAKNMESDVLQGRILTNLADNEVSAGNLSLAEEFASRARQAFGADSGTDWLRFVDGTQAHIRLLQGDATAAEPFINAAFADVDMATTSLSFEEMHDVAQQVYAKLGNYEAAFAHHQRLKALTDEAKKASASANGALLEAQFSFAEQKLNIERLKSTQLETDLALEQEKERSLTYMGVATLAGVLVLFSILMAFAYRRHRDQVSRVNSALEDSIEQRDREIAYRIAAEQELVVAKELAEQANEAKTTFLATMSHELRTPMNGILGFADVLKGSGLNEDQATYVDIIKSSGDTLLTLINDILDLSKIEAGKLSIANRLFNLNDTVEEAVKLLETKAAEKNLSLALHVDPRLPTHVNGDPDRLRQVLINLVGNAIKFTEKGSVAVVVNFDELSDEIQFSVLDSGIGIAEDKLDILFERFSQIDGTSTRNYNGTGLGLAISKELVEGMNGAINVKSEEGIGSNFWFTLPLEAAEEAEVLPRRKDRQFAKLANVLVVDENDLNTKIYSLILPAMNAKVAFAENAQQALRMAKEAHDGDNGYDYVIVNDALNDCSADELSLLLQAVDGAENRKMLLSSARPYSANEVRNVGYDGFIGQPISERTVFASFHKMLLGDKRPSQPEQLQSNVA